MLSSQCKLLSQGVPGLVSQLQFARLARSRLPSCARAQAGSGIGRGVREL